MAGTLGERKGMPFMHNEFLLVSIIMVFIFALILVAGTREVDPPSWVYKITYLGEMPTTDDEGTSEGLVEKQRTVLDEQGTTSEGMTTTVPVNVNGSLTLNLTFQLTWSDDYGNNDVFEVTISNSSGELAKGTGDQGSVILSVNIEGREESGAVQGDLRGDYDVTIRAASCPGMFESNPFDLDSGNDWTLKVTAKTREQPED